MGLRDWFRRAHAETRSVEDPRVPLSSAEAFNSLFRSWHSAAGVTVTRDVALGVPAIWCAVNFLSGTFGALPAPVYLKTPKGREKADSNNIAILLHDWVNDDYLTSFQWRKQAMVSVLTDGRSLTFIEGKKTGRVTNLWPLDPLCTTVRRVNGRRVYTTKDGGKEYKYDVDEVIDVSFMSMDGVNAMSPVAQMKGAIGLAVAIEQYASKFFLNGGVPPLAMQMPAGASSNAGSRASADVAEMIKTAGNDRRLVLPMPNGHRLESIGFNPEQGQLIEARMMQLREVARIYGLPPVFLQDLEFGTFSNTEQQDLLLVKHTLTQWLECWEAELNAKLFGARSKFYLEFNVDGLLRGDFKTRFEGYASGIQNSILTPNEVRARENLPNKGEEADKLLVQGATVPLGEQKQFGPGQTPQPDEEPPTEPPPADTPTDEPTP